MMKEEEQEETDTKAQETKETKNNFVMLVREAPKNERVSALTTDVPNWVFTFEKMAQLVPYLAKRSARRKLVPVPPES